MKNFINFIVSNSTVIYILVTIIIAFISAIISKDKQKIYTNLYELITEAQKLEITNEDKFTYVLNNSYNNLPVMVKLFVSEDDIKRAIEYTLNKVKDFSKAQVDSTKAKQETIMPVNTEMPNKEIN